VIVVAVDLSRTALCRSYVAVTDVADAIVSIVLRDAAGESVPPLLLLGGPRSLSRVDVAQLVAAALDTTTARADSTPSFASLVVPTPRSAFPMPYAAPLDATMCCDAAAAFMRRPLLDAAAYVETVVTTLVVG
jgi:dTDP-4-dehydrorhamnose reductase